MKYVLDLALSVEILAPTLASPPAFGDVLSPLPQPCAVCEAAGTIIVKARESNLTLGVHLLRWGSTFGAQHEILKPTCF